jgi:hypothetical protein
VDDSVTTFEWQSTGRAGGFHEPERDLKGQTMSRKLHAIWFAPLLLALATTGCTGNVETTDDSVKMEAEVPKVEVGDEAPDLDPATDDDVDIDTPAPGDS